MSSVERYSCAVLGAGEIKDYRAVAQQLAPGCFVVCADGGLAHCWPLGVAPGLLVGDFDSLGEPPPGVECVSLSPDKNYTDSCHAAGEALARGHRKLLLAGMLGGRLDHTLANLNLLGRLAKEGAQALLTDGITQVRALAGPGELALPFRPGCYFSLVALAPCRGVTILGGKYPLEEYDLAGDDPRAISNEFAGGAVCIRQRSGLLVAISCPRD